MPLSLVLQPNATQDMTEWLDMSFDEAKDTLLKSYDVQRLKQVGYLAELELPPKEEARAKFRARQAADRVKREDAQAILDAQQYTIVETPVKNSKMILTEDLDLSTSPSPATSPTTSQLPVTDGSQVVDEVEPSMQQLVEEALPSTRWSREKLLAYALDRKLDVNESTSKNNILRKIRSLG